MFVKTYNQKGEETGKTELPERIFGVKLNPDLIHQVVVSQQANRRQGTAHAKTRAEVSGGGRKPWRQKGTGRARHGSIRSPIWVGGGVAFGPRKEKIYKKRIPKKMRRLALFSVLSEKSRQNLIFILDKIELESAKTKFMAQAIDNLRGKIKAFEKGSILIALDKKDDEIIRACRNIPKVRIMEARELNPLDLLSYKYLVMPKGAIGIIEETFLKNNKR